MAIFAQRTTFRSQGQIPVYIPNQPNGGDILVFDSSICAFVAKSCSVGGGDGVVGAGNISDGENLGTGARIFAGLDSMADTMMFRSLVSGPGISIAEDAPSIGEITIQNDIITDACITVPDDFKLVIDANDDTVCDARFEIFTFANAAEVNSTVVSTTSPNLDIQVFTDTLFVTNGRFTSTVTDFVAAGFVNNMCITVSGTDEQDGQYRISSVSANELIINQPFLDPTDAGLQPPTTFTGTSFEFLSTTTFRITGVDWVAEGFSVSDSITISGSTDNDGVYTIANIAGDIITINELFTGTIDCEFGIVSVTLPPENVSSGWWVDECGRMQANATNICGDLTVECGGNVTVDNDLTVNGQIFVGSILLEDFIAMQQLDFPDEPGYVAQDTVGNFVSREILAGPGIVVDNGDAVAGDTVVSADDFILTLAGDVSGSATINSLSDTTIPVVLTDIIGGGTFNRVTVDTKGRVTFGFNQAIQGQNGITITNGDGVAGPPIVAADDFNLSFTGDVSGSAMVNGLSDTNVILTLASIGTPSGSYNRVSVNNRGQVTFGSNQPIVGGPGIVITNATGVTGNPTIDPEDFTITFTGDLTGTADIIDLDDAFANLTLNSVITPGTFTQVSVDAKGRVIAGSNPTLNFQPLDDDLTNLADGMDDPGFVVWDGMSYVDQQLSGIVNEISIINGSGANSGLTEIGLADNPIIPGQASVTVPAGSTALRPTVPVNGMLRYNSDTGCFEVYASSQWQPLAKGDLDDYLPLAGGTMLGDINMEGNNITFTTGLVDGRDVSADGEVLDAINDGAGIKVQLGPGEFTNREITAAPNSGIVIDRGEGRFGNPEIDWDVSEFPDIPPATIIDRCQDKLLLVRESESIQPVFQEWVDAPTSSGPPFRIVNSGQSVIGDSGDMGKYSQTAKPVQSTSTKLYWEIRNESAQDHSAHIGMRLPNTTNPHDLGVTPGSLSIDSMGGLYGHNGTTLLGTSTVPGVDLTPRGSTVMIALDYQNQEIWFGVDGVWLNSGDPALGTNPTFTNIGLGAWKPAVGIESIVLPMGAWTANFGNDLTNTPFRYTIPSGFGVDWGVEQVTETDVVQVTPRDIEPEFAFQYWLTMG